APELPPMTSARTSPASSFSRLPSSRGCKPATVVRVPKIARGLMLSYRARAGWWRHVTAEEGKMVGVARIELATPAMSTQCSTTELHAHPKLGLGRLGALTRRRQRCVQALSISLMAIDRPRQFVDIPADLRRDSARAAHRYAGPVDDMIGARRGQRHGRLPIPQHELGLDREAIG